MWCPKMRKHISNHLYGLYLRMVYISHSMLWTEISDPSHEGIAGNHLGSTIGMYQIYFQKCHVYVSLAGFKPGA